MSSTLPRNDGDFLGCFGCGPENEVGLGLVFTREAESVVTSVVLTREHAGYRDFAHGGIVATLLDESMGWALLHVHGCYGVTRGLRIEYRRPVHIGTRVIVRARVISSEGSSVRLQATVEDERGRVLSRGEGDWVTVRSERAAARSE